jgi:hypothetical protein
VVRSVKADSANPKKSELDKLIVRRPAAVKAPAGKPGELDGG